MSDGLEASVRHEMTHVVLNSACRDAPIWIDEGLAQCYESGRDDHWSDRAADVLRKDPWRRSVPRAMTLEKLSSMSQLGPREYAGSWANLRHLL